MSTTRNVINTNTGMVHKGMNRSRTLAHKVDFNFPPAPLCMTGHSRTTRFQETDDPSTCTKCGIQ